MISAEPCRLIFTRNRLTIYVHGWKSKAGLTLHRSFRPSWPSVRRSEPGSLALPVRIFRWESESENPLPPRITGVWNADLNGSEDANEFFPEARKRSG